MKKSEPLYINAENVKWHHCSGDSQVASHQMVKHGDSRIIHLFSKMYT
jgi:hypothetical protein